MFPLLPALALGGIVLCTAVARLLLPPLDPLLWRLQWSVRERTIALTFDDGPVEPWTTQILHLLQEHRVPATFFVLGERARGAAHTIRRMEEAGHAVGNHSMHHKRLILHARHTAEREIDGCTDVLTQILRHPPSLFRAPHGFLRPGLGRLLRTRGLRHIAWTRGIWDTERPAPAPTRLVERATRRPKKLEILLLHDGTRRHDPHDERSATVAALPDIIAFYQKHGYRFVTIPQLLQENT